MFDAVAWADLRREAALHTRARQAALRAGEWSLNVAGSDIDGRAIMRAQRNIEQAGLPADLIRVGVTDLGSGQYLPPWRNLPEGPAATGVRPRGMVVGNPPYGARMAAGRSPGPREDPRSFERDQRHAEVMTRCGDTLRRWFGGWSLHLITTDPDLPVQLQLVPRRDRHHLFNGAMACQFYHFDIPEAGRS
jgi:23S rRNA G2445 N2-methylase RlmL